MRSPVRHQRRLFVSASLGLLLGACGGGSEDDAGATREDPSARVRADAETSNGATAKRRRRARPYARRGVTAIVASPDGSSVGVAYADGRVRLLDATGSGERQVLKRRGGTAIAGLVFSADGRYLVAVGRDSVATGWNVETGDRRFSLQGHEHGLRAVAASADGSVIATAGDETRVMLWDGSSGKLKGILGGHSDFVNAVSVSGNGDLVASGDADARVLVWRLSTGKLLHTLRGHADEVNAVAFSGDGALVVSAGEDGKVLLWDMATGRQLHAFEGHRMPVRSLALNQDGSLLAGGTVDGSVVVWDMATRRMIRETSASSSAVNVVMFDRRGENKVFVGDEEDGVLTWKLPGR